MRFFHINLNEIPKIMLLGKETLIPPRMHLTRNLTEFVMYVVTGGSLQIAVNHEPVTLVRGDICFFQHDDHQLPLESSFCEYFYIHFQWDSVWEEELSESEYTQRMQHKREMSMRTDSFSTRCYDFLDITVCQKNHIEDEGLFGEITDTLQKCILTSGHKELEKRYALSTMIGAVLLKLETNSIQISGGSEKLEKTYDTARKIAAYIEQNFAEPISGKHIEQMFFITFDYANRVFRRVMGCSIVKYRNIVRIQNAKARMRATDMRITEIAAEQGFDDIHYFSRVFKQIEGLSPMDYKRKFMKISDEE